MSLTVGTWNAAGLTGKELDLRDYAEKHSIDFIFLCETWAKVDSRPPSDEFVIWSPFAQKQNRTRPPYGVALWTRHGHINREKFKILGGVPGFTIWWSYGNVLYGGIYLPPGMSIKDCQDLQSFPSGAEAASFEKFILLGDFNMRLGLMTGDSVTSSRDKILS